MDSSALTISHDYLDIDSIIAVNTKVTTKMESTVCKLGFIDPACDSENIVKNTKLELPIWLTRELYNDGLATFELPKGYNESFRQVLEADANVVDLHRLGPNYYRLGQFLAALNLPESTAIANCLVDTFYQRLRRIMDFSSNSPTSLTPEISQFLSKLDNEEVKLFEESRKAMEKFKAWEDRRIEKISSNELVTKLRKRKRAAMELD